MSEKGSTRFLDFIKKFDQDFCRSSSKWQNLCTEKHLEGANNFQNFVIPALDDTKRVEKNFQSILHYVKQTIWKPWSDRQHEFVVLTCSEDEAFSILNCLLVLSAIAFKEGDTTSLEEIQRIVVQHQHHPGAGFVMNNLGVMFSENAMYKKSEKCFDIAKSYYERTLCRQDNQRDACAVVTLNLAVLRMVLGNYEEAERLSAVAASLCHDISMRTTEDVHLPWKLMRRVADMLKEFGNYKQLHNILGIGVHYGVSGTDEDATIDLTKQLMKIQLKEECDKAIQAEEVEDYISYLFALLDKPAAELLNAEFIGTVMSAAKIHRNIGHHEEACKLLEKLKNTFLEVHGGRRSLCGSLLYQIGSFLHGSGRFDEAASVLKQAKEILIHHFGRSHHAVTVCKSLLGSCVLLKGNSKVALNHLNEALAMFKNLNPNHPEVGEILLKLALLYVEEGKFQYAQETVQQAEDIFISTCGEGSRKTAVAYFQLGMILQKVDEFRTSAVDKIEKAIEMLLNLGLNLDHPDVKLCIGVLGVLQRSLGMAEEAEKCFLEVQSNASLCEDSCSMTPKIFTAEVTNLHFHVEFDNSRGRFSSREARVISLVNLVHMKKCDERGKHLDTLVSCLEEFKMSVDLQIWDFAGQNVYCVLHRMPVSDRPVFIIIDMLESDNRTDSDIFLSSSAKKSHSILFSRVPHKVQEIKEAKCLASAFRESVNTLFLQPKFRKGFLEGKDFYMELTVPTGPGDVSSLCSQIDCLPLLVELELSESQEQCDNFDYLTSWEHSVKSVEPSAHVCYFTYKCSSQRETEFVFDHLIHSLDQNLALNKVQAVVSNVSPLQNAASFFFQEPWNLSLSVTVDSHSVLVKCRTIKEPELNCVCSSVKNVLDVAMESCQTVGVNFESSAWLTCEGVGSGFGIEESSSRNCNLGVQSDPSCSALTSGTGDLIPCASACSGDPELELKRKPTAETVDMLKDHENLEVDPPVGNPCNNFHADVDVCLSLLSCLLSQARPVSPEEEALSSNSSAESSTDFARCNSNSQDNHDHSFLSVGSSSSLNSLPSSPSMFSVSGHCPFTSKKSSYDCLSSENCGHPPETSTCMNSKLVSKNSSTDSYKGNGISVKLPEKPSPDGCRMPSYEADLTAGECCPDPETKKTKQLEDSNQLQTSITGEGEEGRLCFAIDRKGTGVQDVCTNDNELLSTEWHEGRASSEKIDAGTLTDDCLRPLLANLEDELAVSQKKFYDLQQQISQLEEQLSQSEEEKQNLQADLGKYQFLEEKEKRREKLLGGAAPMQDPGGHVHLSNAKKKGHERLLGGAAPVQDPGFALHERLLEISNSLSAEEVKRIKFLAKSKVNGFQVDGFRLARCTEAFELFEELQSNGEFPCDYIGKLLGGIQRHDLVDKLGLQVPLPMAERGSNHPPGQSMPDRKHELPDHATNSPISMTAQDYSMDEPSDRHDIERHMSNGGNRNDYFSRTEETDYDCSQYASISSSESSDETRHYTTENELTCSDLAELRINAESGSSSLQSTGNAKECTRLPNSSDDSFLSDSSYSTTVRSSNSLVNSTQTAQAADSNCTTQVSSDSTDSSPMLTSVNSHSTVGSNEISSDSGLTPTSSEEENLRSSQMLANGGKESEDKDVCDGAIRTAPSCISACAVSTRTNSSDSSTCGFVRTHSGANVGNIPWSQQGAFPSAEMAAGGTHTSGAFSGTATDWGQQGARPKQGQAQRSVIRQMPGKPFIPVTDGLAGDFLARHTQDKALHDSLYQSVGTELPLFNDTPSQGTSYIDGVVNVSDSNKAKPYFGNCEAASGTDPCSTLGLSSGRFDGRVISNSEHLHTNNGPLPSHLGDNYFSVYGNYSQRNTSNATNGLPLQSGFVHNNSRFSEHFGSPFHVPLETQQRPYPSIPSNQFVNSGVTGSGFGDFAWNSTTLGTQSGHPVYRAQRYSSFNDNTSTSAQTIRQTPQNTKLALGNFSSGTTNNDNVPSASVRNIPHEDVQNSALPAAHAVSSCDPTRATGLNSTTTSWPSLVCHSSNTTTVGDDVLAQGSASGTSIPEPSCGNTDNHRASVLNNRDFGTDSVESTDNSLVALEQRVAEACALVERVLREREEREQFGREIERKEQLIREQRARERREREEREIQEAERWPQQQEAITARSQWLCEHYQRHCRVRFPCCTQFFPCHRCHNISKACDNEEAKACHASHLKCSHCQHEQEIGEDSEKCRKCGGKMSAYFCSICKHFTSIDKNPYHCEKCGICRIHKDKSFHCEVCNVCLDKRLQGNHKCRPDSGHDECCICLEDAFSGCQILPCSHKVHRECAIAMIQNGIRTCPICRHPLYSPPRE